MAYFSTAFSNGKIGRRHGKQRQRGKSFGKPWADKPLLVQDHFCSLKQSLRVASRRCWVVMLEGTGSPSPKSADLSLAHFMSPAIQRQICHLWPLQAGHPSQQSQKSYFPLIFPCPKEESFETQPLLAAGLARLGLHHSITALGSVFAVQVLPPSHQAGRVSPACHDLTSHTARGQVTALQLPGLAVRVSSAWGLWSIACSSLGGCLVDVLWTQIRCPASLAALEHLNIYQPFTRHLKNTLASFLCAPHMAVSRNLHFIFSFPLFPPTASCSPPRLLVSPLLRGLQLQQLFLTAQLPVAAPSSARGAEGVRSPRLPQCESTQLIPEGLNHLALHWSRWGALPCQLGAEILSSDRS